jgi:signal transduction histidine kinase
MSQAVEPSRAKEADRQREFRAVTRVAQHVWLVVAFVIIWRHFSYVRPHLQHEDWQIYSLYFAAVAGTAFRYLTGIKHGHSRWHRLVFDGLSILFIAFGVNFTGGINSDLWLVYFIFIIAETLAASARGVLLTDTFAIGSYVLATWPRVFDQQYAEILITRIFFLVIVASIARTLAQEERIRQQDLGALREALSVSEERRRLARDLHDGIGHILTRVILSLEVARRQARPDPDAAAECVAQQATALRGAMEEMRQIVATLRTDTASLNLQAVVRHVASEMTDTGELQVEVRAPDEALPLSVNRQYHLSRVVQEALTNALRHSGAEQARVSIEVVESPVLPRKVVAVVEDTGKGFDPQNLNGGGHGLTGMRERLAPYGGSVNIEASPGQGTRVTAEVPADIDEDEREGW